MFSVFNAGRAGRTGAHRVPGNPRGQGETMISGSCLMPPRSFPHSLKSACAVFLRVTDKLFKCVTDR